MNAETTAQSAFLFKKLKDNKVTKLSVTFYGQGDDGTMEIADIYWKDGEVRYNPMDDETPFSMNVDELVYEISGEILYSYGVDYCNNAGNEGYIIFDTESGEIKTTYRTYGQVEEKLYI